MPERAIILIRKGGPDQQQYACLDYITKRGYVADSLAHHTADAAAIVAAGAATVVVAAYDDAGDVDLERRLAATGGRLEYVRPPKVRRIRDHDLVVGMYQRGMQAAAIAGVLGLDLAAVVELLRRAGLRT